MSIYYEILVGVRERVQDAVGANIPVVIRRRAEFLATDALPIVIIAPDQDGERIKMEAFNAHVTWAYPVIVALFTKANQKLSVGQDDLDLRENIRNELYQMAPLTGQSGVYDLDIELSGAFNLREPRHTTEVDSFRVIYKSSETRRA